MKLLDNGITNNRSRDNNNNNGLGGHFHNHSVNIISEIKENNKKFEEKILSPIKKNNILEEIETNLINISLDDLIRHFALFEIFLEMEVV